MACGHCPPSLDGHTRTFQTSRNRKQSLGVPLDLSVWRFSTRQSARCISNRPSLLHQSCSQPVLRSVALDCKLTLQIVIAEHWRQLLLYLLEGQLMGWQPIPQSTSLWSSYRRILQSWLKRGMNLDRSLRSTPVPWCLWAPPSGWSRTLSWDLWQHPGLPEGGQCRAHSSFSVALSFCSAWDFSVEVFREASWGVHHAISWHLHRFPQTQRRGSRPRLPPPRNPSIVSLTVLCQTSGTLLIPNVSLFKRIHEGPGFRIPASGFSISTLWIPDSNLSSNAIWLNQLRLSYQSGFRIPNHCGFRILVSGFRIPTAKICWIADSLTMGDKRHPFPTITPKRRVEHRAWVSWNRSLTQSDWISWSDYHPERKRSCRAPVNISRRHFFNGFRWIMFSLNDLVQVPKDRCRSSRFRSVSWRSSAMEPTVSTLWPSRGRLRPPTEWSPSSRCPLWPLAPSLARAQPASQYHVLSGKPHWACEDLLGEWRLPPSGDRSVSTTWRTMSLAVMQTSPNHSLVHNLEQQCCFSSVHLYPQQNLAPYSLLPASSVERVPCVPVRPWRSPVIPAYKSNGNI